MNLMKEKINKQISDIRTSVNTMKQDENDPTSLKLDSKTQGSETTERKLELKRQKKAINDAIVLTPLSTARLKPIKVDTKGGGYIKIREDGWVVQYLHKQQKKLYISADGQSL